MQLLRVDNGDQRKLICTFQWGWGGAEGGGVFVLLLQPFHDLRLCNLYCQEESVIAINTNP